MSTTSLRPPLAVECDDPWASGIVAAFQWLYMNDLHPPFTYEDINDELERVPYTFDKDAKYLRLLFGRGMEEVEYSTYDVDRGLESFEGYLEIERHFAGKNINERELRRSYGMWRDFQRAVLAVQDEYAPRYLKFNRQATLEDVIQLIKDGYGIFIDGDIQNNGFSQVMVVYDYSSRRGGQFITYDPAKGVVTLTSETVLAACSDMGAWRPARF